MTIHRDPAGIVPFGNQVGPVPSFIDDFAVPMYPAPRWARPRRRVGAVLTAVGLLMAGSFLAGMVAYGLVWGAQ